MVGSDYYTISDSGGHYVYRRVLYPAFVISASFKIEHTILSFSFLSRTCASYSSSFRRKENIIALTTYRFYEELLK